MKYAVLKQVPGPEDLVRVWLVKVSELLVLDAATGEALVLAR